MTTKKSTKTIAQKFAEKFERNATLVPVKCPHCGSNTQESLEKEKRQQEAYDKVWNDMHDSCEQVGIMGDMDEALYFFADGSAIHETVGVGLVPLTAAKAAKEEKRIVYAEAYTAKA